MRKQILDDGGNDKSRMGNVFKSKSFLFFLFFILTTGLTLSLTAVPSLTLAASSAPESIPAQVMPAVPVISVSQPPLPKVSDISLSMELAKAENALKSGNDGQAKNLYENILLDYPENKIPMGVYLGLATADRHLSQNPAVLNLLLPLLKSQILAQSSPQEKTAYLYSIGMADNALKNDLGTTHYLLGIYPSLDKPAWALAATKALAPILGKTQPIDAIILFGKARAKMIREYQNQMSPLIEQLIKEHLTQPADAERIRSEFPESFPGDAALFQSMAIHKANKDTIPAEMEGILLLSSYPSSTLTKEVQDSLNTLTLPSEQRLVGLIIPPLSKNPLAPYLRSVLRGVYAAYKAHQVHRWAPLVRTTGPGSSLLTTFSEMEKKDGVVSLIGPILPGDLKKLSSILRSQRLIAITPTLFAPPGIKGLRSVATLPEMIGKAAALESLAVNPKGNAISLYPQLPYGKLLTGVFKKTLTRNGGVYLQGFPYNPRNADIQSAVEEIKTLGQVIPVTSIGTKNPDIRILGPDLVSYKGERFTLFEGSGSSGSKRSFFYPPFRTIFLPDISGHPELILRELAYKGIQNQLIIGNETLMSGERIPDIALLGSVKSVAGFTPNALPIENPDVRAYTGTYGAFPDPFALQTIDAAELINQSIQKRVTTSRQLAYIIRQKTHYKALSGSIRWNDSGLSEKHVGVFGYNDGKWVQENRFWVDGQE